MIDFDEMKAALKADLPDDTGKAQLGLVAIAEIERLRAALEELAKACYDDAFQDNKQRVAAALIVAGEVLSRETSEERGE